MKTNVQEVNRNIYDFKNKDNTEKVTESTLEAYSDNYKSKIKFKKLLEKTNFSNKNIIDWS